MFPRKYNTHRLSVPNVKFFKINIFVLLEKICKMYKVVWNGIGCCDINVKVMVVTPWMLHSNLLNSNSSTFPFFLHLKKNCKVFGKSTVTFWHILAYLVNLFVFNYIWKLWLQLIKNIQNSARENVKNKLCVLQL